MATGGSAPGRAQVGLKTAGSDRWWLAPVRIGVILLFFIVYATIRIFMNKWYWVDAYHYLTPLYSPCVTSSCVEGSSHLGTWFGNFPLFALNLHRYFFYGALIFGVLNIYDGVQAFHGDGGGFGIGLGTVIIWI